MNILLLFLLKSSLCMIVLYFVFRILMRKQTFFQLNRVILLSIVGFSVIIPLVHLPQPMQPAVSFQWTPVADKIEVYDLNLPAETAQTGAEFVGQPLEITSPKFAYSWSKSQQTIYFSGLLVVLLGSLTGFLNILLLFRKVPVISKNGFRLLVAPGDIPAFSLGRYLFISKIDFETNGHTILTHEKAHIRHGHFYDLLLLEVVKIIYWFNPVIYFLIRDLKAVHEFQADDSTLHHGIDATQYQLLIIQKGVGHHKFALANSFNHCQIKNRIVMMNKQKSNKAWSWTAAAFLPLLALLLMAFGRTGEKAPLENPVNKDFPIQKNVIVKDSTTKFDERVYAGVEQMPEFPGGDKAKTEWFRKHLIYPEEAKASGLNGSVIIHFVVDSKGKVKDAKIWKSTNPVFDAEALRIITIMPDWIPGRKGHVPVSVALPATISFEVASTPDHANQSSKVDFGIFTPPPPPPLLVIELRKDEFYVDNKLSSLEGLRKTLELIATNNPKRWIRIKTINDSDKRLETQVKEMLKKRNASYQISWTSK